MPEYRLYCLDKKGQIIKRDDFEAPNDEAALAYADKHHPKTDCEIWELGRLVKRVRRL